MRQIIRNKFGEKLELEIERSAQPQKGRLAFVQHGLSGHKGQIMVRRPIEAFLQNGYTVVSFDSRFSFGNSDGPLENATLSSFIADLQTVIDWAKEQSFYAEPFALSGHSLGGGSVLYFAENAPQKVNLLVPVSAMVGGKYFIRSRMLNENAVYQQWKKAGKLYRELRSHPEKNGWLSFDVVSDMLKYDLVKNAGTITAATLLITGDSDKSSTIYNNSKLFNALTCRRQLLILEHCTHLFEQSANGQDLYLATDKWIKQNV